MTKIRVLIISMLISCLITGCAMFGRPAERARYIIGFETEAASMVQSLIAEKIPVLEQYRIIEGVLAMLSADEVEWIRKTLPIKFVERDMIQRIPSPPAGAIPTIQADSEIGWEIKMIGGVLDEDGLPQVWHRTKGQNVLVGIIDTGVDSTHPDLIDAVIGGYNGITDSHEGWEDDNGHGTSVAGAVAGRKNGTGIVGMAPLASIYVLKGLDKDGMGYTSWLLRCFQKALDLELDMVNCSWGSAFESQALSAAMENLAAWQGMGVVCAAGNEGGSPIIWPARNPVAVCVTAVQTDGGLAPFSNFGEAVKKNGVAAPGRWVLAAKMGGGTRRISGTSIAAPYVTGLLALTKAMGWPWRRWIFEGATTFEHPTIEFGYGIIDAGKSIDKLVEASQ